MLQIPFWKMRLSVLGGIALSSSLAFVVGRWDNPKSIVLGLCGLLFVWSYVYNILYIYYYLKSYNKTWIALNQAHRSAGTQNGTCMLTA